MLNWNWSYALSTSVLALAMVSSLTSHSAQAQTGTQLEVTDGNVSTSVKPSSSSNSLKVGETRSQSLIRTQDDSIARIHTHKLNGKNAATVYVRGIPVVTYIESDDSVNLSKNKNESEGVKKSFELTKLPSSNLKTDFNDLAKVTNDNPDYL